MNRIAEPLIPASPASPVVRGQGLVLNWTGGGAKPVLITGAATVAGADPDTGVFRCATTGDKKTFTVPASVLEQLPPANTMTLTFSASNQGAPFTAPLAAGGNLDNGVVISSASAAFSVALR